MKKLMFAVAAIAAGIAVADVTSSNIVGYQNKGIGETKDKLTADVFNFVSPTFASVSGNLTLGDLKFKVETSGGSTLQFFNGGGATMVVTPEMIGQDAYDEFGAVDAVFVFCNDADAESYGIEPGWYLYDDFMGAGAYPMNKVVLRKGQSVVVDVQDPDLEVCSAGEVDKGENGEVVLPHTPDVFNFMGNITPVNLTLGDLVFKVATSGGSTLQFFNGGGATLVATPDLIGQDAFDEFGAVDAVFVFCNEEDAESYGIVPGWYLYDDFMGAGAYPMNSISLPAGYGFVVDAQDADLEVVLPSAIKE